MKYSFIIPFKFSDKQRLNNLICTLQSLPKNIEIILHQIDNDILKKINLNLDNIKHIFSICNDEVFHRAWVINKAIKQYCTSDICIISDADLIFPINYIDIIEKYFKYGYIIGWNEIFYLSMRASQKYLINKKLINEPDTTVTTYMKHPEIRGGCGGVTIINRKLFLDVKGIPEDFKGTWGREDNAFVYKMKAFGYNFNTLPAQLYHLHHEHRTIKVKSIQDKFLIMQNWNKLQWEYHNNMIGNKWGE